MLEQSSDNLDENELPKPFDIARISIYGLSLMSVGIFFFLPLINLLHPSPWQRLMGTIHGFASILATLVAAYVGHLAFPLLRGVGKILSKVRILTFWATFLSILAIVSGNWCYMRYSAGSEFGGAKAWFQQNTPLVHYIFAQYHEFSSLFTIPLGIACTWVLWFYGDNILHKQNRPILVATSITLMALMFFSMGGLVSGLAITKIHAL